MLVGLKMEEEGYEFLQPPLVSPVLLILCSGAEREQHLQVLC